MPNCSINGATIHYVEAGRGPGIVLVHGFPLSSRMWDRQVHALSERFHVVAPDLHGFGRSASNDPFTIESLADELHALLMQLTLRSVALAGFSMGGYVALAYAKKYPKDLCALILVDTRAEADTAEGKLNREKQIELVKRAGATAIAEQMLPKMLSRRTVTNAPQVTQAVREQIESTSARTIEHALLAMRDRPDHTDQLASIAVPTLILVGEEDAITPPDLSKKMSDLIPHSRLAIVSGAGHLSPMENPDDVALEIRDFLDALPNP